MKIFNESFCKKSATIFVSLGVLFMSVSCHNEDVELESLDSKNASYSSKIRNGQKVETVTGDLPGFGFDAVTVDKRGNIFVSEFGRFTSSGPDGTSIFKITKKGEVKEFASDLSGPLGNATDQRGNFYVVNGSNGEDGDVLKITPDGTQIKLATIDGFPSGLTLDKRNNIYVSNFTSPTVHKITQTGEVSVYATDPRLAGGVGIDFDNRGNLIVGNYTTADILSINRRGNISLIATIPDIVINGAGIGYITVANNTIFATGISVHKIFSVSLDGKIEVFAGNGEADSVDGELLEASFNSPNGITIDKRTRTLHISEYSRTRIRTIQLY
ncbi:hypothetical protein GCM10022393_08660 [Aquimarina addita]|uniref:SMP-30/Gluconolactonase/LRE-like region domain-containing protein n=1 Tax=Aquimarina addita TaxID=870485 RepID=A0ABP7XCR4_9FLAO